MAVPWPFQQLDYFHFLPDLVETWQPKSLPMSRGSLAALLDGCLHECARHAQTSEARAGDHGPCSCGLAACGGTSHHPGNSDALLAPTVSEGAVQKLFMMEGARDML